MGVYKSNAKIIIILALRLAGVFAQFLLSVIIVRQLGIVSSGQYFTAFSIAMIVAAVGRFGMELGLVRILSSGYITSKTRENALVFYSFILSMGFTICPLLLKSIDYLMNWGVMNAILGPEVSSILSHFLYGVLAYNGAILFAQAFLAKNKQIANILYLNLLWPLWFCIIIFVFGAESPDDVANLFIFANLVVLLIAVTHWSLINGLRFDLHVWGELKSLFHSAKELLGAEVAVQISAWFPILILGVILSASDATVYTAAQRVSLLLLVVTQALNAYIAPRYAQLQNKNKKALALEFKQINRLIYFLSFPMALTLLAFPQLPLYFFGLEVSKANFTVRTLVIIQCINIFIGSSSMLLIMSGLERYYKRAMISSAIVITLLSIPCSIWFGLNGMLIAVGLATIIMAVFIIYSLKHRLNLSLLP